MYVVKSKINTNFLEIPSEGLKEHYFSIYVDIS